MEEENNIKNIFDKKPLTDEILEFTKVVNIKLICLMIMVYNEVHINNPAQIETLKGLITQIGTPFATVLERLYDIYLLLMKMNISLLPEEMQEEATKIEEQKREKHNKELEEFQQSLSNDDDDTDSEEDEEETV